ncbi:MAG: hypothetical protein JOY56_13310, partial [Solirubrobacterales bacterium]|nr:hypothetical protein [Solirubrobacterales bacterium]
RLEQRIDQLGSSTAIEKRLGAIEEVLARLEATLEAQAASPAAVASEVGDSGPPAQG